MRCCIIAHLHDEAAFSRESGRHKEWMALWVLFSVSNTYLCSI